MKCWSQGQDIVVWTLFFSTRNSMVAPTHPTSIVFRGQRNR
jgi:hypothetical protein